MSKFTDSLTATLKHYRFLFQDARRRGDLQDAKECGIVVARLQIELEKAGCVRLVEDTEAQFLDPSIGYVRSRLLELEHIEELLLDDKAAGIVALNRWIQKIQMADAPAKTG
jgi:hypothetical protein